MLSEIKILTRLKQWKGDKSNPVPVCGQRVDETKAHRISFPFMLGHFHMSPLLSCPSITFYSGQDSCLGLKHIHSSAVHQIAPNTVILQSSWRRGWRVGGTKCQGGRAVLVSPLTLTLWTPRGLWCGHFTFDVQHLEKGQMSFPVRAHRIVWMQKSEQDLEIIVVHLMKDEKLNVCVVKVCVFVPVTLVNYAKHIIWS